MTEEQRIKLHEKALETMKKRKAKERAKKKKEKMEALGIKPPKKRKPGRPKKIGRPKKRYHKKGRHKCRKDENGNWIPTKKQLKAREAYKRRGQKLAEKTRIAHIKETWKKKKAEMRKARKEREKILAAEKRAEKRAKEKERRAAKKLREKEKAKEKKRLKWEADAPKRAERSRKLHLAAVHRYYYRKKSTERIRNMWLGKPGPQRTYFVVCLAKNGHIERDKYFKQFKTQEEAQEYLNGMLEEQKSVLFDIKHTVCSAKYPRTQPMTYEYLLCQKPWGEDLGKTYLKNEFGKYVEHIIEDDNMVLMEKYPARFEEKVWVYGYDPVHDRKTFAWVFNELLNTGFNGIADLKRIYQYRNKIVFCNDANEIDLIILKNISDAARFYNLLEEYCQTGPYLMMGFFGTGNYLSPWLEEKIQEKTGWTMGKIKQNEKS